MWDSLACADAKILTHITISIAVVKNVPTDAGLQKRATFSILNVGLTGTGNQTQATYMASSFTRRSSILYTKGFFFSLHRYIIVCFYDILLTLPYLWSHNSL
jgi:hypothetical protein